MGGRRCGEGGRGERDSTSERDNSESVSLLMVSAIACTGGVGGASMGGRWGGERGGRRVEGIMVGKGGNDRPGD